MATYRDYTHALSLFCVSSVGMMLGNKLAVTALPLPCTLILIQTVGSLILLFFFREHVDPITKSMWKEWLPIALLFSLMLFSSLNSFLYVNVSTVIILRNVGAIVTTIAEYFARGERVNAEIVASEIAILIGAVLYGQRNASFNMTGLCWVLFNVCCQTAYGIILKQFMTNKIHFSTVSKYTMSLMNNVLAFPMLGLMATAEYGLITDTLTAVTPGGWFWILCTCGLGFMISTSGFGLQKLVSATTFIVINNLVKFFNIVLCVVFLGDRMALVDGIGCFIALIAGTWYSHALYRYKTKNEKNESDFVVLVNNENNSKTES